MKKIISFILTVAMIMSTMTFNVSTVNAATVTHGEYTTIEMADNLLTSKAFLSTATAGTITDAETVYPHFFMGSGVGKAYAVSKESIDRLITNGVLTGNGVPFKVKTLDNQKSAMGCTSNKVAIPTGYYSKIHVLTVGSPDYTGDNTIYRGILGPDASGEISMNLISTQYVADLAWAKVKSTDDLSGKANPKLMVETFEISDKTKRFDKISFWLQSSSSKRILAVTTEGLKGSEWNPIIAKKISALPEASAYTEANAAAVTEVDKLIALAKEGGADISAISGIAKYNQIKEKQNALAARFVPINVSSHFNAIGYVSKEKAGTYSTDDANMKYPHFFKNSGGTASSPMAISSEAVKELAPDGIANLNGVPYYLSAPADDKNGVIKAASQVIDVPNGYYSSVRILAVYNPTGGGDNTFYNNYYTVSGGEVSATKTESQAGIIKRAKVLTTDAEPADIKLIEFKYEFKDKTKEIDSVKIWQQNETQIRVLAVTMEGFSITEWNQIIAPKISELPDVSKYTQNDYEKIEAIDKLMEKAEASGTDITAIDGYEKYNNLKKHIKKIEELYMPLDLTGKYNAIGYLSSKKAGTYSAGDESLKYPNFFMNNGGSAASPSALSKEGMDALTVDGKAILGGTVYNIPAPADGEKGVINCESFGKMNVPEDRYSQIKVLMVYGRTGGGNNGVFPSFTYSDGTKGTYTLVERTVGSVAWTNVLTTDNVNANVSLVEFTFTLNEKDKKLSEFGVYTLPESILKCLAITLVKSDNETLDNIISETLKDLPAVENIGLSACLKLSEVSKEVEELKGRSDTDSLPGLKKYNQYIKKIDELCSGDEIVIYVDDDGDDFNVTGAPLKSLEAAKNLVRGLKERYPDKSYRVVFREGVYRFDNGVSFDKEDSGTADKPVIYEGYAGEKVQFKGSKVIDCSSITEITDENIKALLKDDVKDKVYQIDLKEQEIENIPAFSSNTWLEAKEYAGIYLDEKEQPIAQYPNGDAKYSIWESVINPGGTGSSTTDLAVIKVSDEEAKRWGQADDFWIGGYFARDYRYERVNGKSVDTENMTITFAKGTDSTVCSNESRRWKIFNLIEELDSPGEWYIDREEMILYYYPPKDMAGETLEISTLADNFITMTETENIVIRNIEFSESKADVINMGKNVKNVKIRNCGFKHIGKAGIRTQGSVKGSFEGGYNYLDAPSEIEVSDCNFYNIGSSAVFMYGGGNRETLTRSENKIVNNYIEKATQNRKCIAAITIEGGMGTTVKNNAIHNIPFHAINFFGNDHTITYNEIENACNESTDASVIYTGRSYVMRGNEVAYNFIHDYRVIDDKIPLEQTSAIYLDDLMSGVNVHHNIIVNGQTGIHVSGGQDNDIENNIILKTDRVFYTGNPGNDPNKIGDLDDVAAYVIETFPEWAVKYPDILLTLEEPGPPHRNVMRYNLSDIKPSIIDSFVKRGTITDNLVTEENIFVNPDLLDYRVKSDSEMASTLTDIPTNANFDINMVGLKVSENRPSVNPLNDENNGFSKYYPLNNTVNVNPYNCTFHWEESQYADSYKLVIATDADLENIVYEDEVYTNFCTVKNLDAGSKKYYWQVYAQNNLRQINGEFSAIDGVRAFETKGSEWVYESDSKPYISVDLSGKYNGKVFLSEGKSNSSMSSAPCLNRTSLDKKSEKSRNVLNADGIVYKLADKSLANDAVKSAKYTKTTISLENENCESVSFLATADQVISDYTVKVYYTDNSSTSTKFEIGAYNGTDTANELMLIPDFKMGTVNYSTGKATKAAGYIYKYTIPTSVDKKVSKIEFASNRNGNIYVLAITQVLPEKVVLSDGTTRYNMILNSENETSADVVCALYDGEERLVSVKKQSVEFNGEKEKLVKVQTPKTEKDYEEARIYIWNGQDKITPYSDKIIKEVGDEK